jgi:hypothetical protein
MLLKQVLKITFKNHYIAPHETVTSNSDGMTGDHILH